MKYCGLLICSLIVITLSGCTNDVPKPEIKQEKQLIAKSVTNNHYKVLDFKEMIDNDESIAPIYIYIHESLSAEASSGELPDIKKLTYSLLSDFGKKVVVLTSAATYNEYVVNPEISSQVYLLDGALTSYDKSIEAESSSTSLNISIGSMGEKKKNSNKFKNKKKKSQIIADFFLKQNHIITHKTTSSIFLRETNKGYQFGLSLYGVSLGVSSYKNIKDGLGLSVRKIVEASLIDLVAKASNIQTFQIMPEVQMQKDAKKRKHLSNFDFCNDINKLVFYIDALEDRKFNAYGITNESEKNKLKCLKSLYEKQSNSEKILIKIKSMVGEYTNISTAQKHAQFIRRQINALGIPRDSLIMENAKTISNCEEGDDAYCRFINNRVELQKLVRHQ